MAKDYLTDAQVEAEIERLTNSDEVKLARTEQRIKYKHRQYLYTLRNLKKRGEQLMAEGITAENIELKLFGHQVDEI